MIYSLLILFSFFLLQPSIVHAQTDPVVLEAEKDLVYYSADIINADLITETVNLKGNVKILFDEYELNAKNAYVSKKENILKAWGDVRMEGNTSYIEAEKVDLNYKTQKGDIYNVRLTSGQLLLEARQIEKINNEVYKAKKAKFTTCATCPPSWRIKGKEITTNINKYVDIKGGRFQVLNQTLFPIPRVVFPLNTRRKTGLLATEFENSSANSGLEIAQPFFWAIDPHKDLTISPMIYVKINEEEVFKVRGTKLHAEYNQWLGSKSHLHFNTAWMYDDAFLNTDGLPNPDTRWFLHYNNQFVLPRDVVQKSQFTILKEREYLNDFISEVSGRGEPALKNTFSLSKVKNNSFMSAEAVYYINLLVEEPKVSENFSIHKLPELKYSIAETPFLKNRFLFNFNTTYTNFHRNSRSFDEVSTDSSDPTNTTKDIDSENPSGQFNTQEDLIRTGQRLRLNAEISAPFRIGDLFDVKPTISYRDAYYHFDLSKELAVNNEASDPYSQFAFSRYLEFSNSIRTEFSRVFNNEVKHKIVPEIIFKYGSPINQSENVFFRGRDNDLPYHRQYQPITDDDFFASPNGGGVQFDYWDRFFRANVVELSLTNIFIKKHRQELVTYYDQPFFFSLKQSFDFKNEAEAEIPDPWSNLDAVLKLKSDRFTNHTQASYFYKAKRTNITTSNNFTYQPGRYIGFGYSDFSTVDQRGELTNNRTQTVNFSLGWKFPTLTLSGSTSYSLLQEKSLGWDTSLAYAPAGGCWQIGLRLWELVNQKKEKPNVRFSFRLNFGPDARTRKSVLTI